MHLTADARRLSEQLLALASARDYVQTLQALGAWIAGELGQRPHHLPEAGWRAGCVSDPDVFAGDLCHPAMPFYPKQEPAWGEAERSEE